jgi:hypothetical protein
MAHTHWFVNNGSLGPLGQNRYYHRHTKLRYSHQSNNNNNKTCNSSITRLSWWWMTSGEMVLVYSESDSIVSIL